jgi:AcrR family transcriptional regulator
MSAAVGARERGKAERHLRIKEAALALFLERGYDETTTREIAQRAGVAQGTLFLYVSDKRDLLLMVMNDDLDVLTATSFASVNPDDALLDQLMHVFKPRLEYWGSRPELSRFALSEVTDSRQKTRSSVEAARHSFRRGTMFSNVAKLMRACQERGQARRDEDPTQMAWVIMCLYIAMVRMWIAGPEPRVAAGLAELRTGMRLAIRGLSAEPS